MSQLGQFISFIKYLWDHAGQLTVLFQSMPSGLRAAGSGMEIAGDGALVTGKTLGGDAALPVNAADVLQQAANAVDQCYQQVRVVAQEIRDVADALDQVRIPTVTPVKRHFDLRIIGLGEHDLVTGLSFDDASLFGAATSGMRRQANLMESSVGGQLHIASQRLGSMSQTLDSAGNSLKSLGDSLKQGGTALQQLGS
ncbi:MAG: hypothetical protein ABIH46_09340 [Chloroflexota bacterium]